jgi:hypothetical protein
VIAGLGGERTEGGSALAGVEMQEGQAVKERNGAGEAEGQVGEQGGARVGQDVAQDDPVIGQAERINGADMVEPAGTQGFRTDGGDQRGSAKGEHGDEQGHQAMAEQAGEDDEQE